MTDIERLSQAVVAETHTIRRVERLLAQQRAPYLGGQPVGEWLDEHRARLDDLYAALCDAWLEQQT